MNIEQLKAALAAKMQRKAELEKLINGGEGEQERDEEKLAALVEEAKTIVPEINKLQADLRSALQAEASQAFSGVNPMEPVNHNTQERNNSTMTTKTKLSYMLGFAARKKELTEDNMKDLMGEAGAAEFATFLRDNRMPQEKRAVGVALTTTATTYVAASSGADGVNNGGVFIKTSVLLDLLREEGKLTPILNDVFAYSIKGLLAFPYRSSRSSAAPKKEGVKVADDQMQWTTLTLVKGSLQIVIKVTDDLEELTDFDFGAYLAEQIVQDLTEDWSSEVIYGIGTNDSNGIPHIAGVTYGIVASGTGKKKLTHASGTACKLAWIEAAVKLLTGVQRRGAKIYVAQDCYDEIAFAKDSHGDYILPVLNGSAGVRSVAGIPVEVDETLAAGDFIIGNVAKYYKFNLLAPLRVERTRDSEDANAGRTQYCVKQSAAGKSVPGAFVYVTTVASGGTADLT